MDEYCYNFTSLLLKFMHAHARYYANILLHSNRGQQIRTIFMCACGNYLLVKLLSQCNSVSWHQDLTLQQQWIKNYFYIVSNSPFLMILALIMKLKHAVALCCNIKFSFGFYGKTDSENDHRERRFSWSGCNHWQRWWWNLKTKCRGLILFQPATHNVTQCCMQQNVSSSCMNTCSFYLDIEAAMEIPDCIEDLNKLMKCASGEWFLLVVLKTCGRAVQKIS